VKDSEVRGQEQVKNQARAFTVQSKTEAATPQSPCLRAHIKVNLNQMPACLPLPHNFVIIIITSFILHILAALFSGFATCGSVQF
jgi:hypothetical protein